LLQKNRTPSTRQVQKDNSFSFLFLDKEGLLGVTHLVLLFDGVVGINNSFIEPAEQGITLRNFMMDVL
jgi:hypothetical protein